MAIHRHHSTPVHLGGIGPIQLLEDRDHAAVHARRFLDGEDVGFHMSLLKFLDEDLAKQVRDKQSELMKTERNPGHGTSFVKGRTWWNNGRIEVLEFECPIGYEPGRLSFSPVTKQKMSVTQIGLAWWNDGKIEVQSRIQPSGFVKGRLPRKGNTWKKVLLIDTLTGETTLFESQKLCSIFLNVSRKVVMNRLKTGKLIHGQFKVYSG